MVEHRRAAELRADGRRIVGTVMAYGATASVRDLEGRAVLERFKPGAFTGWLQRHGPTELNLQHDQSVTIARTGDPGRLGSLRLQDSADELRMVATLPSGRAFDLALDLVRGGDTAETSVEFVATREHRDGDQRMIEAAELPAIGVVASGAYGSAGAVEVRRRRTVQANVRYGREYSCECSGPQCSRAVFEPGSFRLGDETLAVWGQYHAPIASVSGGGLRLDLDDTGLRLDLDVPSPERHEAAKAMLQASAVAPIIARPLVDRRTAVSTEDGDTRRYTEAPIRAIVLAATDKVEGWTPIEFEEQRRADPPRRRRRVWL